MYDLRKLKEPPEPKSTAPIRSPAPCGQLLKPKEKEFYASCEAPQERFQVPTNAPSYNVKFEDTAIHVSEDMKEKVHGRKKKSSKK